MLRPTAFSSPSNRYARNLIPSDDALSIDPGRSGPEHMVDWTRVTFFGISGAERAQPQGPRPRWPRADATVPFGSGAGALPRSDAPPWPSRHRFHLEFPFERQRQWTGRDRCCHRPPALGIPDKVAGWAHRLDKAPGSPGFGLLPSVGTGQMACVLNAPRGRRGPRAGALRTPSRSFLRPSSFGPHVSLDAPTSLRPRWPRKRGSTGSHQRVGVPPQPLVMPHPRADRPYRGTPPRHRPIRHGYPQHGETLGINPNSATTCRLLKTPQGR